jgi:hypothetical protein
MTINRDALEPLVRALGGYPAVQKDGLQFSGVGDARFQEIDPGTLLWSWGERRPGERGKAALAYYDLDGQIVSVGLLADGNEVKEIELWRGDGTALLSVPSKDDLWEMVPGHTYSPRS